jgi:hypothetical protein
LIAVFAFAPVLFVSALFDFFELADAHAQSVFLVPVLHKHPYRIQFLSAERTVNLEPCLIDRVFVMDASTRKWSFNEC